MIRMAIILNGISSKKKFFYAQVYPRLKENFDVEIFETQYAGHAIELAQQATVKGYDIILSAGGDGTLNQVLNGILKAPGSSNPSLGLLPMGSANDFARASGAKLSVERVIDILKKNSPTLVDIGEITCLDRNGNSVTRYFINACSVGMGPLVVERLEKNRRRLGPSLSYLSSIITTFLTHKPQLVKCKTNTWEWEGKARVLALANGVAFGNGIFIAPDANQQDGLLNMFWAGDVPLVKFLFYLQTIKAKRKIIDKEVHYSSTTSIELSAPDRCALEAEGEIIGFLPAKVEIKPLRIMFHGF